MPSPQPIRLPIRQLVEFLLRTGSIDSRFTGFDRANEGARIHRRLQKAAGEGYAAEVYLTAQREVEGLLFVLEGRADGIFQNEDGTVVIDEIKTTALPTEELTEDRNPCHWAQGMVYGAIYAAQNQLERLSVRLTYYQIDTDEIAPTGIGKTMSALFPALKAIGAGSGEKLFYLTARSTTQAAAEDALARLHASTPGLALRSVTLTAKEKVCLCKDAEGHPACLPEACPYANGYYERIKDALAALLDGAPQFDRAALEAAARQFTVCPFELGLDLSAWADVVIGDYNYLFDPVVRLHRFFDAAGDWLFLIDEAHNLPDRARAMYSAGFAKSALTDAKRALGRGKSSLKTALSRADRAFLEARKQVAVLAPRRGISPPAADAGGHGLLPGAARRPAQAAPRLAGPFAGLAGAKPRCRRPRPAAGALFCRAGHHPRS